LGELSKQIDVRGTGETALRCKIFYGKGEELELIGAWVRKHIPP
jgi:hypothetical protein